MSDKNGIMIDLNSSFMNMQEIIVQLELFSERIITLDKPVSAEEIDSFEKRTKLILPNDYKILLKRYNGINLMGTIVYGILKGEISISLEEAFNFEHQEVDNVIFDYLIPFSPDGVGNHYCFDTRTYNDESCNVVFWQHNYLYTDNDQPETTHFSFAMWLKEVVIDWTLDDYDYEGNPKSK